MDSMFWLNWCFSLLYLGYYVGGFSYIISRVLWNFVDYIIAIVDIFEGGFVIGLHDWLFWSRLVG